MFGIGAAMLLPFIMILITLAIGVGQGLFEIFEGVAQEFIELPQGLFIGAMSVSRLVQTLGVFGISNFFCGLKMMKNFTSCAFYYLLEILGSILYFIPMIVFMIVDWLSGKSKMGTRLESNIWYYLEKLDRYTIDQFGFHVIHFSKSVRDKCYNCRRLKPVAFVRRTGEFAGDLNDHIIPLSTGGLMKIFSGFGRIIGAFDVL